MLDGIGPSLGVARQVEWMPEIQDIVFHREAKYRDHGIKGILLAFTDSGYYLYLQKDGLPNFKAYFLSFPICRLPSTLSAIMRCPLYILRHSLWSVTTFSVMHTVKNGELFGYKSPASCSVIQYSC